jgi:hypothetical protein
MLFSSDWLAIMEIVCLIPQENIFKMNINILGTFWRDWEWSFGHPMVSFDSRRFYSILHQRNLLDSVFNAW